MFQSVGSIYLELLSSRIFVKKKKRESFDASLAQFPCTQKDLMHTTENKQGLQKDAVIQMYSSSINMNIYLSEPKRVVLPRPCLQVI